MHIMHILPSLSLQTFFYIQSKENIWQFSDSRECFIIWERSLEFLWPRLRGRWAANWIFLCIHATIGGEVLHSHTRIQSAHCYATKRKKMFSYHTMHQALSVCYGFCFSKCFPTEFSRLYSVSLHAIAGFCLLLISQWPPSFFLRFCPHFHKYFLVLVLSYIPLFLLFSFCIDIHFIFLEI